MSLCLKYFHFSTLLALVLLEYNLYQLPYTAVAIILLKIS